jgi:hypothetical protein
LQRVLLPELNSPMMAMRGLRVSGILQVLSCPGRT